ncbi:DUF1461 domain-containing protein [Candidatus Woesearchaeota archaeon]|nr:DUF1461 domain-containing protein [Candidatus Woesearchaeota archaeon]
MAKKDRAWRYIICSILIVPLFILVGFVGVFYDHGENSVYAKQEWTPEQERIANDTFTFLNFEEVKLTAYNDKEILHLIDVRNRFKTLFRTAGIILLALIILILTAKQTRELFQNMLFYGGLGTLGVIVLLAILALIDFENFWIQFHYIVFPHGNWAFPEGSTLIQLFPERFFFNFAISTILAIGSYGLASTLIGYLWKRKF